MFDNEDEFAEAVKNMRIDTDPDPVHQEELREQMLAVYKQGATGERRAGSRGPFFRLRRSIVNRKIIQVAAVAVIVIGIVGLWGVFHWGNGGGGIVLADVLRNIEKTATICFKMDFYRDGKFEDTGDIMYLAPGLMRMEMPGMVCIYDWRKGHMLALMTDAKTAHSCAISDMKNPYQSNWLEDLKKIIGSESAEEVGEKEIRGATAKGWCVKEDGEVATIWADAKTGKLLEADFEAANARIVMREFQYNKELPESLFSLTPPSEYKFHTQVTMKASDPSVKDIVVLLRIWALGNKNVFPDSLDSRKFSQAASEVSSKQLGIKSQEEALAMQQAIGRAFAFLYMWGRHEWTYTGKGVRLGEKDRAVFRSRKKGQKNYQVIYGDLSVKEVASDDLPGQRMQGKDEAVIARSTLPPKGSESGLVSDFEQDPKLKPAARFGFGWMVSTDSIMGGKSSAEMKIVQGGAKKSGQSLLITGEVAAGQEIAWAGAMFCPGKWPFAPANLSSKKAISFWAKGDGQTYAILIYTNRRGYAPAARTFVAGRGWKQFTFLLKDFAGTDGSDITAILFGRSPAPGKFEFQIDDVTFLPAAKPTSRPTP